MTIAHVYRIKEKKLHYDKHGGELQFVTHFSERENHINNIPYMSSPVRLSSVCRLFVVCYVRAPYLGE